MNIIEKNLENIILTTPNEVLNQKGLPIYGKKKSQVNLGRYGRADLITFEKSYDYSHLGNFTPALHITIYELKQRELDLNTFGQVSSYLKGLQRYLDKRGKFKNFEINYEIVLVGYSVKKNPQIYFINDLFINANIYLYNVDINGLSFEYWDTNIKYENEGF